MYITVPCPECGGEEEHQVLSESGDLLVQCTQCHTVHRIPAERAARIYAIRTIVSRRDQSMVCTVELEEDEVCGVGDPVIADCEKEGIGVEITGIEVGDRRVNRARASEISTLWTRVIEEVAVKVSVHDKKRTVPLESVFDGESEFTVGETYMFQGIPFRITLIKLRDGALLRKDGWKTVAKRIKRIYGIRL